MSTVDSLFVKLQEDCDKYKEEFAAEFITRVKQRTPVVTGTLRDAWEAITYRQSIEIQNLTPYAGYVEYGTPKMRPRGMLTTTIREVNQISDIAKQRAGIK